MAFLPLLEVSSSLQSYPRAVTTHLEQELSAHTEAPMFSTIASSGKVAAVAKGSNLDVINLITNERLAAWSFSSLDSADPEAEITCLTLLSVSHVIVGLDTGLHGALAVFDITEGRVVRSVTLPQRVASLALIAASGGPAVPNYLHSALMYFHGMVAVGLLEGKVLIIDLNMDEIEESKEPGPAGLYFISPATRDVARCRRKALEVGTHLALELGDWSRGEMFVWGEEMFAGDSVQVSCLYHCPQLASLCVGFNLGCWTILSLTSLDSIYSSTVPANPRPVVGLTWQEPLDDPRHYSYLWVCRGALVSLYSLVCRERTVDCGYRDLETVALRWEHYLTGELHTETATSRLISVETLETLMNTGGAQDRSRDSEGDRDMGRDLSLVCLVWEVEDDGEKICYLGVWDINCWYQAQMPSSVEEGVVCPYLSLCEVSPDLQVSCLHVDSDTITRFGGAVEQHFYPSSLKFNCSIISAEGHIQVTHLGLQRKVLAELSKTQSLVQPSELYQFCLMSGLVNGPQLEPSLLQQRRALLDLALEQSLVSIVITAVREWSDGKYSKVGCNLKFLLDWAWSRVVTIKDTIDTNTLGLFDHTMSDTDEGARGVLASLSGQLAQLVTVLSSLSSQGGEITELGLDTLECKLNVTGLVLLYSQAISWFLNVGLLPEQPEGPHSPYPVSVLERQYRDKRRQMGGCQGPFGRPGLLVDILCEDIGEDLIKSFQKGGGTGCYPPPSLHSLIAIFLSEAPAPSKLRLVQYFFLDLAHLLAQHQFPDLVDSLIKFPSAFSLPPSIIKLTQAFWLLDHEDWEDSVSMMLDPLLQEDDLTPEHHRAVLVSLLAQGQAGLALKYSRIRRPPVNTAQDISLHISVLLANGAIQEAFTFQRSRRSSNLLPVFYKKAEELGKLDSVLQLSLTAEEEREFVSFLQSSSRPDSQEVLLMYYLQRSRFTEALQLNSSLQVRGVSTGARDAIMSRYRDILPGLANTLSTRRVTLAPTTLQARPVPLSVTLQDKNIKLTSHATQIEAMLATPRQARREAAMTPFRPKERRNTNIVKALDITNTTKRKAEEDEGKENESVFFPIESDFSLNNPSSKNTTNIVSPPRKRTRLSDVSSLNMSVKSMRKMSKYMTADAISILTTPTIRKVRSNVGGLRIDAESSPASILKVKQLMKDVPVEGDKMLDVSLSLDKTPTMMSRSRDTTPTKSLRFKEPRRFPSGLAVEEKKLDTNESQASNETNESFFSLMDVESPLARERSPVRTSTIPTSVSPQTKIQLEKVLNEAENKLKEKENLVLSSSKHSSSSSRISGISSSFIGTKDIFVSNEEESVDSDLSMRGKVYHRWVGEDKEDETGEEDLEEDEDEKYYENKIFEKKDCDIVVESEDSNEDSNQVVDGEQEVVIDDSSEDEGASNIKVMNFSWAAPSTAQNIDDDIVRLINEEETIETASTSVNFNEDEELYVEEIDQDTSIEINIETPTEIGSNPIEIEDSPVEEKSRAKLIFSEGSLVEEEDDDVIEIESDEEKHENEEPEIPTGKLLFSSMFSSNDEEEYLEDDQPDNPVDLYVPSTEVVPEELQEFSYTDPVQGETGDTQERGEPEEAPAEVAQEQDVMRDLLDNVSTTATRASSIAGSLLELESRTGSVTGETGRALNYSFSEPGNTETEDEEKVQSEPVNFVFSQPLDTCQPSDREEISEDFKSIETTSKEDPVKEDPIEENEEDEEVEEDETEKDSSDESSDDGEVVEGLNFSWAVIPENKNVSINQIISDEISSLSFAAPHVEAEDGSVEDCNDSKFEFLHPNDESMNMDVEESDAEAIDEVGSASLAVKEIEILSNLPGTTMEEFKEDTETTSTTGSVSEEFGKTSSELSKNNEEEPPALAEASTFPSEDQKTPEKAEGPTVSLQTPSQTEQLETPLRRSSRKSSKEAEKSMKSDTPSSVTPTRKSSRKAKTPIKIESSPKEVDITTQLEAIEEENSRSSTDMKAEVPSQSQRSSSRKKASSSNVSSHSKSVVEASEDTAVKRRPSGSQTPATPVRRSRRLSGATPVLTPVLPSRSRRLSGAQSRNTPTVIETEEERQGQFDTLELRNRDVVETLSLTENFGQNSPDEGKPRTRGRGKETEELNTTNAGLDTSAKKASSKSTRGGQSPATPKRSSRISKSSLIGEKSPTTPKRSSRSSKKVDISLEEVEVKPPSTPEKISAIPKHLTPLKQATPLKEDVKTPTRRTRRVSASETSAEQMSPVRRSRRLSGASAELSSAPDGGLISGVTPRRTPRSRRHNTSVKAEDVDAALANIGGSVTPLPTLVEDVESEDGEAVPKDPTPKRGRGRGRRPAGAPAVSTPSLDVISEEGVAEPSAQPAKPSTSRGKRKQLEEEEEVATPPAKRRSRRVTITVLDTDVDLLGSPLVKTTGEERRKSASSATGTRKKYIPVKKKTSVKIK